MAEVTPEFAAMAKVALGTDDPERIAALKEAIVICFEEHDAGGYEEEMPAEGGGGELATLFGKA